MPRPRLTAAMKARVERVTKIIEGLRVTNPPAAAAIEAYIDRVLAQAKRRDKPRRGL